MKIHMKSGDKEFRFEATESILNGEDPSVLILKLYKEMFASDIAQVPVKISAPSKGDSETFSEHYGCKPAQPMAERDTFSFRERLPNNVVDISKLSVQEAVTENALVRCPKCGQSHAIVLKDGSKLYLMKRTYHLNEFGIVKEIDDTPEDVIGICCMNKTPDGKLDYFFKIQGLALQDDKDFAVNNETEVFCPVCGESSPFIAWKDAYEHKEHYFEFEHVCGACGGECVMDAKEEKDGQGLVVCTQCGRKWFKEQV